MKKSLINLFIIFFSVACAIPLKAQTYNFSYTYDAPAERHL
jgi:hypothetical protein